MNKNALILLGVVIFAPLLCLLILLVGNAFGVPIERLVTLVSLVFPIALLALILGSYYHKECLYFHVTRYSTDSVRVTITADKSPILFHTLQTLLIALFIFLTVVIVKWDMNTRQNQSFHSIAGSARSE